MIEIMMMMMMFGILMMIMMTVMVMMMIMMTVIVMMKMMISTPHSKGIGEFSNSPSSKAENGEAGEDFGEEGM